MAVQNEPPAEATDDYLRTARSSSSGVLPSRQRFSLSYIRGRCPRLLRVVPSRHQSACGRLVIWISILTGHDATYRTLLSILIGQMLHIALCCLEGSTLSNLVHRRRRCARIVLHSILLPGGQYARGWVSHQARISLWLQGSLFFTAIGSYFVFWGLRRYCRAGLGVAA